MKLSDYAKRNGISYGTAWRHYKAGLIPHATQLATGTIVIGEASSLQERTAVYARVSSPENKTDLLNQSKRVQDFCAANGWVVSIIVEEYGSGLNDERKKLRKLLLDDSVTRIVVEHKDRLTRFGFNYIKDLWHGELVVINEVITEEQDLMQDFVSLITSFTARLYGRRRSKRQTEKLIESLKNDDSERL